MAELTYTQHDILQLLEWSKDMWPGGWLRPMDIGAGDGSYHSVVLRALVTKGLAERKQRGGMALARASYLYRITDEGRRALSAPQSDDPRPNV